MPKLDDYDMEYRPGAYCYFRGRFSNKLFMSDCCEYKSGSTPHNPPVCNRVPALSGRAVIGLRERDLWPAQEFLHEHRREWML